MAASGEAPHGVVDVVCGGPAADEAGRLAAGDAFAWRLSLERCRDALGADWTTLGFEADGAWIRAEPERLGDAILARKEFPASYHLASVYDDAVQGVTHVIRGEDLREAAHLHVLLQKLLGLPTPVYAHHRLVVGADGKRLAKRDHAATLHAMRAAGATPSTLRAQIGLGA